jgi:hypothetical protein
MTLSMPREHAMNEPAGADASRTDADQREVIAFLGSRTSFSGAGEQAAGGMPAERHDTHGAHVFLAGDLALKIKRAVTYSYMDFSTLESRHHALLRELEVNRPNAPELYLDVVPITRDPNGRLRLGGDSPPLEWALRMHRFEQDALLSRRIAGELDSAMLKAVADEVFRCHASAAVLSPEEPSNSFSAIIDELSTAFASGPPGISAARSFAAAASTRLEREGGVIVRRAKAGFVRRCHGDLHLDNIVILQGRPRLFDAIEFDESLASIDTLYDLAFLLMDLDARGAAPAANVVLNRYLWRSRAALDQEGLAALPLFLALRAGVRSMVCEARAKLLSPPADAAIRRDAARYLDCAMRYLSPPPPLLVAVGGLSGTGKSTLAAALAPLVGPAPGAVHLRSDLERKALHGVDEFTRLPDAAYAPAESRRVYEAISAKARSVLSAGHSAIVDAVFSSPSERRDLETVARACNVAFLGVWLHTDGAKLIERVAARSGDASDATPQVVASQLERDPGPIDWHRVDAGFGPADVRDRALALVAPHFLRTRPEMKPPG